MNKFLLVSLGLLLLAAGAVFAGGTQEGTAAVQNAEFEMWTT